MSEIEENVQDFSVEDQSEDSTLDQDNSSALDESGVDSNDSVEEEESTTEKPKGINENILSNLDEFFSKTVVKAGLIDTVNMRMGTLSIGEKGVLVVGTGWIQRNNPCAGQVFILHESGTMSVMTVASFKEAFSAGETEE